MSWLDTLGNVGKAALVSTKNVAEGIGQVVLDLPSIVTKGKIDRTILGRPTPEKPLPPIAATTNPITPAIRAEGAQAIQAKAPALAQSVIDHIIGRQGSDAQTLDSIKFLESAPDLITQSFATVAGPQTPFTPAGQQTLAVNDPTSQAARNATPWSLPETLLTDMFKADTTGRAKTLYLRENAPLSLLPALLEQNMPKVSGGKHWYSFAMDAVGRPIAAVKNTFNYLQSVADATEESYGWGYYNDIADPYLRTVMGQHIGAIAGPLTVFGAGFSSNRQYIERTMAEEKKVEASGTRASAPFALFAWVPNDGPAKARMMQQYFKDEPGGAFATLNNLSFQVAVNPLNFVPVEWIGKALSVTTKLAGVPIAGKAALGAENIGALSRVIGPRGRSLLGQFSAETIMNMSKSDYAYNVANTLPKGLSAGLRTLTEYDPVNLGAETGRQLKIELMRHSNTLFHASGDPSALPDVIKTIFQTGKPEGWVAENIPNLMENEAIAKYSGAIRGQNPLKTAFGKLLKSDAWSQLDDPSMAAHWEAAVKPNVPGLETVDAAKETVKATLLSDAFYGSVEESARVAQQNLFKQLPAGNFIMNKMRPVLQGMRSALSFVTLNNPAFMMLKGSNDLLTYMWSAAAHPLQASEIAARSLGAEFSTVLPGGGGYGGLFKFVEKLGVTPEGIEAGISRSASTQDLFGAGKITNYDKVPVEQMIGEISDKLASPIKTVWNQRSIRSKAYAFLTGVTKLDRAFRRATFINSLATEKSIGVVPSWIARTLSPGVYGRLTESGVAEEDARRAEGIITDATKNWLHKGDILPGEDAKTSLERHVKARIDEAFGNKTLSSVLSASDMADQHFVQNLGIVAKEGRQVLFKDFEQPILDVNNILHNVTPETDLQDVLTQLKAVAHPWYSQHELASYLANSPSLARGNAELRLNRLAITSNSMKQDMLDRSLINSHVLQLQYPPMTWAKPAADLGGLSPEQHFADIVHGAIKRQSSQLQEINDLHAQASVAGRASFGAGDVPAKTLGLREFQTQASGLTGAPKGTVVVYHGAGKPIEGPLKAGSFVTTDRKAAQTYAEVDWRVRNTAGETGTAPTVHEFHVPKEDLKVAPKDATTLGSPFIVGKDVSPAAPSLSSAEAAARIVQRETQMGRPVSRKVWDALATADRQLMEAGQAASSPERQALQAARQAATDGPRASWMPKRERVVLAHYEPLARASSAGKSDVLDVQKMGTGLAGSEKGRPVRPATLSYYNVDLRKNPDFKPARIFSAANSYRVDADLALAKQDDIRTILTKYHIPAADADHWEQALINEGFDGYTLPSIDLNGRVNETKLFNTIVPDQMDKVNVASIVELTKKNGGVSMTLAGKSPENGAKIFMVGAYPAQNVTVPLDEFNAGVVRKFMVTNRNLLTKPGTHIGTWVHDVNGVKSVDLDISIAARSQDEAMRIGARTGQQSVYDFAAGKSLPVPLADLQRAGTLPTQDVLWNQHFDGNRNAVDEIANTMHTLLDRRSKTPQWLTEAVDHWSGVEKNAIDIHQREIQEALASGGTNEAWAKADDAIGTAYAKARLQRAEVYRIPPSDRPSPAEFMDVAGVQAKDAEGYTNHVAQVVAQNWQKYQSGGMELANTVRPHLDAGIAEAVKGYDSWAQHVVGQASALTDFVMLNVNKSTGFDRGIQAAVPYFYWPSRTAFNWGIRAAQAPGAFNSLALAMSAPNEYAKAHGLPARVGWQIPVPMPFLSEFLNKIPGLGSAVEGGDFGSVYWVDPLKFLFPFREFRQGFEDSKKNDTVLGRIANWTETNTPFSMNPFMKVIGRQVGLLDKDAWQGLSLTGNPLLVPLTTASQSAARWLYNGDTSAIPTSEQSLFSSQGHFSIPFLADILGLDSNGAAQYRAERALWTLAADDQLVPGATHDEQVNAAWTALDTHQGVAWKNAIKAANATRSLQQFTSYLGFPVGPVTAMQKGEEMWLGLQQAFSHAAATNQLDEFYKKYPEFRVRSAVVKGLSSPAEKQTMIDTELYYRDIESYVNAPYKQELDQIDSGLAQMRDLPQTQEIRDNISVLNDSRQQIAVEQSQRRQLLDYAYPNREQTLSLARPPLDRALADERSKFFDIKQNPGETYQAFQTRQQQFYDQLPLDGNSDTDWQNLFSEHLITEVSYGVRINAAGSAGDYNLVSDLQTERDAILQSIHDKASAGLDRTTAEDYINSFARAKTSEETKFDAASSMFDTWMSLVGTGSVFSTGQKSAISAYFRSQPEIQEYYPLSTLDLRTLSVEQKLNLMDRRAIWKQYYALNDPELQLSYMKQHEQRLNQINASLGLGPLFILGIPTAPVDANMGTVDRARLNIVLALARERQLAKIPPTNPGLTPNQQLSPEQQAQQIQDQSQLLASDPGDPSSLTGDGVDYYTATQGTPATP